MRALFIALTLLTGAAAVGTYAVTTPAAACRGGSACATASPP